MADKYDFQGGDARATAAAAKESEVEQAPSSPPIIDLTVDAEEDSPPQRGPPPVVGHEPRAPSVEVIDNDDDVPALVENFDEASKNEQKTEDMDVDEQIQVPEDSEEE